MAEGVRFVRQSQWKRQCPCIQHRINDDDTATSNVRFAKQTKCSDPSVARRVVGSKENDQDAPLGTFDDLRRITRRGGVITQRTSTGEACTNPGDLQKMASLL